MSYTTRYRYSFFEKAGLLASFFLVILALICLLFLIQPAPFYEEFLPIAVKNGAEGTLTFDEVIVPNYYEPHFKNLFLSLPGLPSIKAKSISLAFTPRKFFNHKELITSFFAKELTVSSMPRLVLETASIETFQLTTDELAYSFSASVSGNGLGNTSIRGVLPLSEEPHLRADVVSKNIDIRELFKRWHLKWQPTGTAQLKLALEANGNAKKEWNMVPEGTCIVENLSYKGKNFKLSDANVLIGFHKDFIDLKLVNGTFRFKENEAVKISGSLRGDSDSIVLNELLLETSNGGSLSLSAQKLLNHELTSATMKWLPQWKLLQTIVANLEEESHELSLTLEAKAVPAGILSGVPLIKSVGKGTISASIKGTCTLKDDGFYDFSPSGVLSFEDLGAYLNSGVIVTDTTGEIKLDSGIVTILAKEATIYDPRLPPLSGSLFATWSDKTGFTIKNCKLASARGAELFPFDVDLEISHTENEHKVIGSINHRASTAILKLEATKRNTGKFSKSSLNLQLVDCPLPLITDKPLPPFMNDWTLNVSGEALWKPFKNEDSLEDFIKALAANGEVHIQDLLLSDSHKNKVAYLTNYEPFKWEEGKAVSGSVSMNVCNDTELKGTLGKDLLVEMEPLNLKNAIDYLSDSTPLEKLLGELSVNVELSDFYNRTRDRLPSRYKATISLNNPGFEQWKKEKDRISQMTVEVPPIKVAIVSDDDRFVINTLEQSMDSSSSQADELTSPVKVWLDSDNERTKSVVKNFAASWQRVAPMEESQTISRGTIRYNHDFILPTDFFNPSPSESLTEKHYLKASMVVNAYHSKSSPANSFGARFLSDMTGKENQNLKVIALIDSSFGEIETISLSANLDKENSYLNAVMKRSGNNVHLNIDADRFPLRAFNVLNIPSSALLTASLTASHSTSGTLISLIESAGEGRLLSTLKRVAKANLVMKVNSLNVAGKDSKTPEISINNPFTLTSKDNCMSFADFALLIGGHSLAVDGTVGYDGKCNVSLISERVPVDSIVRLARLPVTAAEDSFLTADIKLLGSLPFPSLAGALNLENGIFSFPYLEQKLYFPSLKVTNNRSGSSVKVSGLRWGDSPLELEGQILNEDSMGGGNLSINLSGKNLKATWAGSLLNNIDVSSQIRSTDLEQKADCKITIGDGTIRIPLSFLSSLGQSESVPKGVATENQLDATPSPEDKDSRSDFHTINPTMEELFASGARIFRSVATNLVIEISDSVRVQNAFFDTRVSGNASFSVSKQTPKFAINLNTIGGTLKIHRHTFNISTGTLLYEKLENQNRSALSLICYCRESDYNISLNVAGTFEEPTLSFSSVPPMAQAEIVKLLLLGKQQFAGGQDQGRTESSSNRLATGNVMEATAIDFLATGMLNSLLFTGMADMGTLSVRTDEDVSSYLRLEKKVGRDFLVTFEQLLNEKYDHTTTEDTNVYIKWGIDKDVTIEGKTGGSDDKTESGSYVGMFKNFHFR